MAVTSSTIDENIKLRVVSEKPSAVYPFQRKVKLSEEKEVEVKKDLGYIHEQWKNSYTLLLSQIRRWRNNSENIADSIEFPWEGASAICKPIIETRQNIIHAFFMSIIRPHIGRLFNGTTDDYASEGEKKTARDIAAYLNKNRAFNKQYVEGVSEHVWLLLMDGTDGRVPDWKREVERKWVVETYNDEPSFSEKYPTSQSAGMNENAYLGALARLQNGEAVTFDKEFDFLKKDMAEIGTEELKDLIIYPITVSDQSRTRFLGKQLRLRASELKQGEKDEIFDNVNEILTHDPAGDEEDDVSSSQNQIEGVSEPDKREDYVLMHGRYKKDLDGDGIEEKYLVTYHSQSKIILQFDKYPFYHNEDFIQISWFKKRVKRILGRGVAQMLEDIYTEANIQARHRINSNAISDVPFFKAAETLKSQLDPMIAANRIRPGGFWWLPPQDIDKVKAVEIPHEASFSEKEEALLNQSADNLLGASELRSGRETPSDPRAPAAKVNILLNQSSVRLDDFIFHIILRENECLDIVLKLFYQFGPEKIRFSSDGEEGKEPLEVEIDRLKLGSTNIHLQLSVTSLIDNPDFLRAKWEEFYTKYSAEPMLLAIPEVRHTVLGQIIENMPEARGTKLLLPLEKIKQMLPPPIPEGLGGIGGKTPGKNPTLEKSEKGGGTPYAAS